MEVARFKSPPELSIAVFASAAAGASGAARAPPPSPPPNPAESLVDLDCKPHLPGCGCGFKRTTATRSCWIGGRRTKAHDISGALTASRSQARYGRKRIKGNRSIQNMMSRLIFLEVSPEMGLGYILFALREGKTIQSQTNMQTAGRLQPACGQTGLYRYSRRFSNPEKIKSGGV